MGKTITTDSAIDWDFSLRVNHLNAQIDRFAESIVGTTTPGFGLALEIDGQDIDSTASELGLGISKAFSTGFGVVVPNFNVFWIHEFEDGTDRLRVRFLNDPFSVNFVQSGLDVAGGGLPTIFEIALDENDSNYGRAQLGLNFLFANNWSFTLQANSVISLDAISYQYYSLGARKSF